MWHEVHRSLIKVIPDGIFDTDGLRRDSRVHINIIATHPLRGSLIPMSPRHRPRFASEHSVTFSMSDGLQLTGCSHGAVFNSFNVILLIVERNAGVYFPGQ